MVEDGSHLWQCLIYIDLNIVRAGRASHPRDWEWTGYHELMGHRRRYRLLDLDQVCAAVGAKDLREFREHYERAIEERLARDIVAREPQWTESLAVGSRAFVERISAQLGHRRRLDIQSLANSENSWTLREDNSPYTAFCPLQNRL